MVLYGWDDNFSQVSIIFTALNCPRLTLTSIQLMTPTYAFCEAPEGLQKPGAVSRGFPQLRATSLGKTNNVHQHCPPPPAPTSAPHSHSSA